MSRPVRIGIRIQPQQTDHGAIRDAPARAGDLRLVAEHADQWHAFHDLSVVREWVSWRDARD